MQCVGCDILSWSDLLQLVKLTHLQRGICGTRALVPGVYPEHFSATCTPRETQSGEKQVNYLEVFALASCSVFALDCFHDRA